MQAPAVGSLVVPSPRYRNSVGTGEGAAILLASRRGSSHLFYPGLDRSFWVATKEVREIPVEAVPGDSMERLLFDLLLLVEAEECKVESYDRETMELTVEVPALTREQLSELEGYLRGRLGSIEFAPRSMSRIQLHLRLVLLPDPAPTGT